MKILGIIPARGGSKGIPRKNLADVNGQPLIKFSIDIGNQLVKAATLDRCIVSTDDKEIAEVANSFKADVPFMRPSHAATDKAKAIAYVEHALNFMEEQGQSYDAFMLLQPTSPIRKLNNLINAVNQFKQGRFDSLISCYQEDYVSELVMYDKNEQGSLTPKSNLHNKGVRRQEHGPCYVRNGAVYITKVEYYRATQQIICDNPLLLEMSKLDSIDVDTLDDLTLLRAVLRP